MKKSDVAKLVSYSYLMNNYGIHERTETKRKVFVSVSSVGSSEWFEGSRNGLNPVYRFTMFSHDYEGEKVIEYAGTEYTIYRTYMKSVDEIELYSELRKGNVSVGDEQ